MRSLRIPVLAVLLLTAGPAMAQLKVKDARVYNNRPQQLDVSLVLGYLFGSYSHIGIAGWYGYPIVPDGFFPKLNEALFIEAGAAIERYHYDYSFGFLGSTCEVNWWRVTPMGGAKYNWYLTDDWTVFATSKLGLGLGFNDSLDCAGVTTSDTGVSYTSLVLDVGVGAYWNVSDAWQVRFDLGYYSGAIGAGMPL